MLILDYPVNGHSRERQERVLPLSKIDIATLVVHGCESRMLPYETTAERLPGLIKDLNLVTVKLVTVEGGPHNLGWTHAS